MTIINVYAFLHSGRCGSLVAHTSVFLMTITLSCSANRSGGPFMAAVVAGYRKGLVSDGWPALLLSCINGRRKRSFQLVETPFLAVWMSNLWSEGPDY